VYQYTKNSNKATFTPLAIIHRTINETSRQLVNILAIGAHPDDVEISMFGSLSAWKTIGAAISIAIVTDGARGGSGDLRKLSVQRAKEAEHSSRLLSASLRRLKFPDGDLHTNDRLHRALKNLLQEVKPDLVLTHAPNDYHADHRTLSSAISKAVNFEHPVLWCDTFYGTGFQPTHYIDITDYIDLKCAAIRCHTSQDPERFERIARRHNAFRAQQCGGIENEYAEAFRFEPVYPYADIRTLLPPAPRIRPIKDISNTTDTD